MFWLVLNFPFPKLTTSLFPLVGVRKTSFLKSDLGLPINCLAQPGYGKIEDLLLGLLLSMFLSLVSLVILFPQMRKSFPHAVLVLSKSSFFLALVLV